MTDDLITTPAARRLLGNVSVMFVWRKLRDDLTFPRPIRYSENGPRFWRRSEIERWIEAHRENRRSRDDADQAV